MQPESIDIHILKIADELCSAISKADTPAAIDWSAVIAAFGEFIKVYGPVLLPLIISMFEPKPQKK